MSTEKVKGSGPFAWMAQNIVAANLLMLALLIGGVIFMGRIKQEVFPEFAVDVVRIAVAYPGASPEEVERAITKTIEENVRGVDGVKTVSSTSNEGVSSVMVELMLDSDKDRALNDIKAAVDRITSFPENAERPQTSIIQFRSQVLSLVIYGNTSELALRAIADQTRDRLLQRDDITTVELGGVRPLEIRVDVPRENLRAYGLSLEQVAGAIRAANVELPAGGIKTSSGEILLRTAERRDYGPEFASIGIINSADGTQIKLSDIATVTDGFSESDQEATFNGMPAAMVRVYRVGEQTPLSISASVREFIAENEKDLPPGVKLAVWADRSEMYRDRIDLLMRNARLGLLLVLLSLGLFLEIRLAFWVTMGIPISFLGTFLFLPLTGVSINMISLFAFIVTLGIVVDDAIVVGEAVHKRRGEGLGHAAAAVKGLQDVAGPVIFSVLTTVVAFSPLLFVPGTMGKFFRVIPTVVIIVLMLSLVESLLILPAHLSHETMFAKVMRKVLTMIFGPRLGPFGWIYRGQQRFSDAFQHWVAHRFGPTLKFVVRYRYQSVAGGFALLIASLAFVIGGHINFTFMPKIESDTVFAQLSMPYGTPAAESKEHMQRMLREVQAILDEHGGEEENSRGIYAQVGAANLGGMGRSDIGGAAGGHIAEVSVFLKPPGVRKVGAKELAELWRQRIGEIPGAETLTFKFTTGATGGSPISIQLNHSDVKTLELAAGEVATELRKFDGVTDVDDGVALGKSQLNIKLTNEARALGITEVELARQVRSAFFGTEASRQQRNRDEVRVYVRLPQAERESLRALDELMIRTPRGGEIPLRAAATVTWGRAYTSISREDSRRTISVEADVEEGKTNANKVMSELETGGLKRILAKYPGLGFRLSGQQKEQAESLGTLFSGFKLALVVMFALMAIPFRSYVQPLIIMVAIPFGLVGAIAGHVIMGYDLSILSAMGVVALSGVVVNDSLVLIDAINTFRKEGMGVVSAVVAGGIRRFRPIMLTSITTFLGLAPMILEKSVQARFLVPMALSLGFGVMFSTFVILFLVPAIYLILEDVKALLQSIFGDLIADAPASAEQATPAE